jgi:hypothetical protein
MVYVVKDRRCFNVGVFLLMLILNILRRWRNLDQLVRGTSFRAFGFILKLGVLIKRWFMLPNKRGRCCGINF